MTQGGAGRKAGEALHGGTDQRGRDPGTAAILPPDPVGLAVISLDPTGKGRKRWSNRWKGALNAFDITFDGRLTAGQASR